MNGFREFCCFLTRYWTLCISGNTIKAINEMQDVFYSMDIDGDYTFEQVEIYSRSAESAHKKWLEDWHKGYNYSNHTLADFFDLTEEEQQQMAIIMSEKEAKRRERERDKLKKENKRRADGVQSMTDYNEERKQSKEHLIDMLRRHLERNPKAKRAELAQLLNVHPTYITKLKKEL